MSLRSAFPVLLIVVLALSPGGARAQVSEEAYVQELSTLLTVADLHLTEATDALVQCVERFADCFSDPSLTVRRLNTSRIGLATVRDSVASQEVPERYVVVHRLVLQGLNDSIDGILLHAEGLQEGSVDKFTAGSDLMNVGWEELEAAVELLQATPPSSPLERLLLILLIAIGASLVVSITGILWWYRRAKRRHLPPEEEG